MMATRGKRALALFVTCIMVLGMLPAAALAADSEAEHIHGQAGLAGETYYTGVCDYTEGETVQSETPDLCDEAVNAHEHTDACAAAEEGEAAVCTGELNAHEHTGACYSVTQTEGAWTCETGEPPVVEEPEAEPTQKPAEEPAETTPVEEQIGLMSGEKEDLSYTLTGAKLYKHDGGLAFFSRGNVPEGIEITATAGEAIAPSDLRVHPTTDDGWEFLYNGSAYYYYNLVPCEVQQFYLKKSGDSVELRAKFEYAWSEKDVKVKAKDLRLCADWPFSFYDMGSTGVELAYSIGGGELQPLGLQEHLYLFSNGEAYENAKAVNPDLLIEQFNSKNGIMFFVKAEEGYQPFAGEFEDTDGKSQGEIGPIPDNKNAGYETARASALAQGFTHEFHYFDYGTSWGSGHGIRGFQFRTEKNEIVYTITYHANAPEGTQADGEVASQSGTWNTRFDIAENGYTVSGYEFQGWNTATDGSGESYAPGYTYTIMGKDLDLFAQWTPVIRAQMDAKFFIRQDGTVPMEDGTTGYNYSLYLPTNSTTSGSDDYKELLWGKIYGKAAWTEYKGAIVDGKINGVKLSEAFASVSKEIAAAPSADQIKAVKGVSFDPETQDVAWYVVKNVSGSGWHVDGVIYDKGAKYVLQYFPNAGEDTVNGLPGSKLYAEGAQAPISYGSMAREGYDFLGWSKDPDATQATYTKGGEVQTIAMTGDTYLYAVWQKIPAPVKSYTVTVNYLEENAKEPLKAAYVSNAIEAGKAYDVSEQILETILKGGVTYTCHTVNGDSITGTIEDRNVVVDVYYQADRAYTVEYFLETGHNTGNFVMSEGHSGKGGTLAWNDKPVTSAPYVIAIDGYTYDEANKANVKQVAYGDADQALILKLYYKKDAPVDPGRYTVVYTDGTDLEGAEHQYTVTKTVGETYAVLADNSTTGFAKTGHNFDSWKLREGSVVRGEGNELYGDKDATIYYDAQWTPGAYPVTVTKTASGHSLPDNFAIAIADKDGQTVETLALAQATLDNGVYTWTTSALTFGETYTVTEQNYAVGGYDLTASARVLTGTDENGNVYQTTNGVTASLTLNDPAQTSGTAVAFTNSYSLTNSGGGGGGSDYSYYRVTVNYLDRDGNVLDRAYQTDRIREGRAYDVTEQASKAIDGYRIDEIEGATTGTIRGNVTVNVRYVPDVDNGGNGGTVDIPDTDVPQGDTPDTTPGTVPDGNGDTAGGDGIVIEDGDVPQGGQPDGMGDTGDQTDGKSGGSDETVIIDDDTPKGNLPQTGTLAQQADPTRTAGMLALALSLAAAGLAVTIGRKKEDEA